jgi:hypothetical protein
VQDVLAMMFKTDEDTPMRLAIRREALMDTLKALQENPDLLERLRLLLRPKP